MNREAKKAADHFLKHETEFHLGALPTEQSHPKTRKLSSVISDSIPQGIALLQQVDQDVAHRLPDIFTSPQWQALHAALVIALTNGRKICFSGCGATGRVSILIEAAYRRFLREHPEVKLPNTIYSIMTGGDYALVRSVESFEDFAAYGRRQVQQLGLTKDDLLIAITEGGETSSVIGTAWQALENGAKVFFLCNNPLAVLAEHVQRSREIIDDSRIIKIDLATGPMAIAGSTRMQATTMEILAVAAALELAMQTLRTEPSVASYRDYTQHFTQLLDELAAPQAVNAIADFVRLEEMTYRNRGAITYFAQSALLDIFTDTTERAPTFMLPPFRKCDNDSLPRSWAFVKNPLLTTDQAWQEVYQRQPRCLDWTAADYREMNAPPATIQSPPALNQQELHKFRIGSEDDPSRYAAVGDLALLILIGQEVHTLSTPPSPFCQAFLKSAAPFPHRAGIAIGPYPLTTPNMETRIHIPCSLPESPLRLWEHLAIKLILNTMSTAAMARMNRVVGNHMACVETTNKKLIDRGTRLIAELAEVPYEQACYELFKTLELQKNWTPQQGERPSPVAQTIARLKDKANK